MDTLRLFEELKPAQRILLAGAGGGYDIFCGLPLFFALQRLGKEVHLANLSFSNLSFAQGRRIGPCMIELDAHSDGPKEYFPERYLCEWFESQGQSQKLYGIQAAGVQPLKASYEALVEELGIEAIVLIDGGTDSLMRGDEPQLGTPQEDMLSIAAVHGLQSVATKALVCLGFGIDFFHGVCHAHCLETTALLSQKQAFWGAFSLHLEMPEVQKYIEACEYVFARMPRSVSIVNSSIISALEGQYGDVHRTSRTAGSELWINPLMTLYWCYELDGLAEQVMYLDGLMETEDYFELSARIRAFRQGLSELREWKSIPV